jgi:carbohydrate diacid regulator
MVLSVLTHGNSESQTISVPTEKGKTMDERDALIVIALADHRMNIAEAARVLYMHRNTVVYHIQKIRQNTGLDPLNFYDLYELVKMARKAEI